MTGHMSPGAFAVGEVGSVGEMGVVGARDILGKLVLGLFDTVGKEVVGIAVGPFDVVGPRLAGLLPPVIGDAVGK